MIKKSNIIGLLIALSLPFQALATDTDQQDGVTQSRNIEVQNVNISTENTGINQTIEDPTITHTQSPQTNSESNHGTMDEGNDVR